jgi:CheY-like chemotaxis protein
MQKITERGERVSTLLVINNDAAVRQIIAHHLTLKGFEIRTTASGAEDLGLAALIKPDVITLDILMPDMDGWGVLESLKQDPELRDIPVIMVTMVESRSMGYSLGAVEYLPKPIDKQRLYDIVNHCVRQNTNRSILVVDDDKDMREAIQSVLDFEGWTVGTAASAEAALASINANPPALIMLDLIMPEMDGFEFLDQLRHNPRWKDIPVVIITGKDLTAEERQRLDGRVASIISKSGFAHKDLLDEIFHTVKASLSEREKKRVALT